MELKLHSLYHVYNRGINRQRLFIDPDNYPFFMQKLQYYVVPHCDLLAYCLLPNHFHLLVHANEKTIIPSTHHPSIQMSKFSRGLQLALSSYAKAINCRYDRVGSLFTQNTHAKLTSSDGHLMDYSVWCYLYIHRNPVAAGLVETPGAWQYSSYNEYLGKSSFSLCNTKLGKEILALKPNELIPLHEDPIPEHIIPKLYGKGDFMLKKMKG